MPGPVLENPGDDGGEDLFLTRLVQAFTKVGESLGEVLGDERRDLADSSTESDRIVRGKHRDHRAKLDPDLLQQSEGLQPLDLGRLKWHAEVEHLIERGGAPEGGEQGRVILAQGLMWQPGHRDSNEAEALLTDS